MNRISEPISIIIADNHPVIIEGLCRIIERHQRLTIVETVNHGRELVMAVDRHRPQVVLTDVMMPGLDGVEATRLIKAAHPDINVIGMSEFDDEAIISKMMQAGAMGHILKNAREEDYAIAIDRVTQGKPYYCAGTLNKLLFPPNDIPEKPATAIEFTAREMEIIRLMVQEKTSAQIADELCISTRTVETHRHHIQKKIGVNSVVGIVVFAIMNGYVGDGHKS